MLTKTTKEMKLSSVSPTLVSAPPFAVVRAVKLLANWYNQSTPAFPDDPSGAALAATLEANISRAVNSGFFIWIMERTSARSLTLCLGLRCAFASLLPPSAETPLLLACGRPPRLSAAQGLRRLWLLRQQLAGIRCACESAGR